MVKRQVMTIALAGILAFGAVGCSSSKKSSSDSASTEESTEEVAQEPAEAAAAAEEAPAEQPKYAVTINGAEAGTDYNGDPCLFVHYTFTNVSDEDPAAFTTSVSVDVFQAGIECDIAFADTNGGGETMTKVQTGASIDVTQAYSLRDTTSPVEITVKELFSWDDVVLASQVFELHTN